MPAVKICDVTLRDGLQALDVEARLPLERRVALFDALRRARLPYIEIGSFVNPHVFPAMKSTPDLLAALDPPGAEEIAVLVPNRKYYEKTRGAANITTMAVLLSASEKYSKINTRMSTDEALAAARQVTDAALADGFRVRAYLSYSFREMDNTPIPTDRVVRLCESILALGCEMVAISDTAGTAVPEDIARLTKALRGAVDIDRVGVHFHDRYGLGITNCHVAYEHGVRIFDSAIGGIGGNRMVKGSVSNVSTEELVFMLRAIGADTGIDFDGLLEAGAVVLGMIDALGAPPSQSKILLNGVEGLPAGM